MEEKKKTSAAHIRATTKWESKAYDKILVRIPKGQREQLKQIAEKNGYSLNGFITEAVLEKVERLQQYAEQHGKTVSGMVKQLVMDCINSEDTEQKKDRRVVFHFRGEDYLGFAALLEQLRSVGYDGSEHIVRNYLYKGRIGAESLKKYPMIAEISTDSQGTTEQQDSVNQ